MSYRYPNRRSESAYSSCKAVKSGKVFLCIIFATLFSNTWALGQIIDDGWNDVISQQTLTSSHAQQFDVYVSTASINLNEQPKIHVRSAAPYRLRVYRLGYFGANNRLAEKVLDINLGASNVGRKCGQDSGDEALQANQLSYGLVECDWSAVNQTNIAHPKSGLYLVRGSSEVNSQNLETFATYVVRNDASSSRLVVVHPTTVQAYNAWTDSSATCGDIYSTGYLEYNLYGRECGAGGIGSIQKRALKVSFNRPSSDVTAILKESFPFLRYLEANQMEYSLATDLDLHSSSTITHNRRSVISVGHGEYWSWEARQRLNAFVAAGGNLIVMGANTGYWQIRYEASQVGDGLIVVGHKETALDPAHGGIYACNAVYVVSPGNQCHDPFATDGNPANDHLITTYFRDPRGANQPEQYLLGVQYQISPAANNWELPVTLFTNQIASMPGIGSGIIPAGDKRFGVPSAILTNPRTGLAELIGNFGHEADVIHPHLRLKMKPSNCLQLLGESSWEDRILAIDANQDGIPDGALNPNEFGNYTAHIVLHRPDSNGGLVISGLTMLWSWGVDNWSALNALGGEAVSRVDSQLQLFTRNLLVESENGGFDTLCRTPKQLTIFFDSQAGKADVILKEDEMPGRWAIAPISVSPSGRVELSIDPNATADLSGWASASSDYELFMGEVDNDGPAGEADLIVRHKYLQNDWFFAQRRAGHFVPGPVLALSNWFSGRNDVKFFIADVNGDSLSDIVAKEDIGSWYVALGNGGGTFSASPGAWLDGWGVHSGAYDLFVSDITGDGKADLIAKEKGPEGIWYFVASTGSGFSNFLSTFGPWHSDSSAHQYFVSDVTGDGKADLIAKQNTGDWYVAEGNGDGTFQANEATPPALSGWAYYSGAYDLYLADLNADGAYDIVAKEKYDPGDWYYVLSHKAQGQPMLFVPQSNLLFETIP